MNTEAGIKYIKDERYEDYSEFTKYQTYGKYINVLIEKFLEKLAWSRTPAKLSLVTLNKIFNKFVAFLNNLIKLAKRHSMESQERITYTKLIYSKLFEILHKLDKHKAYSMDYDRIDEFWGSYDSFSSMNFPSNVK